MCAVLLASAMYGVFGSNVSYASPAATGTVSRGLEDVTGKFDLGDIRKSLYNDSVQENTFSEKGKGSVIVRMDGQSIADRYGEKNPSVSFSDYVSSAEGARVGRTIAARQQKALAAMDRKGIDYTLLYTYSAVTNAFAVEMDYEDIDAVRKIDGVADVYVSAEYAVPKYTVATNNAHVYNTGIYNPGDIEETGQGMKVAILDTGLDYTHAAFQTMPTGEGVWTQDDVAQKLNDAQSSDNKNVKWMAKQLMPSVTAEDVYVNAKVPYAFDYADDDANVYPSHSNHGTHVAGIVAGKDEGKHVNENDENETFVGVAPDAQLVICKVFTDDLDDEMLGGASTEAILAALNDCAVLGVDVVNMSLGTTAGFTSSEVETDGFMTGDVYEAVRKAGISLVVAAGNESSSGWGGGNGMNLASDPDSGTVSSPSTYSASISVASINGAESPYALANSDKEGKESVAFITNASDLYNNDVKFVDLVMEQYKDKVQDGKLTLNYVVVSGVGRIADYTGTVRNKLRQPGTIALVRRGDITFSEKVQNAMSAGASAIMIYNHLSGEIRMSLADLEDPIPACSIDLNAGTAMVNNAVGGSGTVTFSKEYTAGPFMSSFSSLGVTPDLKLKPEITAHGGEIWSAVPGGYDTLSGTSMAAPNMAGAVALLRQHFKGTAANNVELNALVYQRLMSTATIANNPDNNPYSPRKQGAGLADIKSAIVSPAYLRVPDGKGGYTDKAKLEYGDDPEKTGVYTMPAFTLTNAGSTTLTYSFDWNVLTETLAINKRTVEENSYMLNDSVVTFTTDNGITNGERGTLVTVPAGGNVDITVTVRLSQAAKAYLDESFANGMYVEGFFRLRGKTGDDVSLSIPFLAFYGDWQQAPMFDYSIYELAVTDADTSIEEARKPKASARASTPLGLFDDGTYIMPLGTYLYEQADDDVKIYPDSKKAAISRYDDPTRRTVYELYMVYGGLLRGAKTMHVTITDAVTGEVVYDKTERNVRKAYAGGGSNVGAPVEVEMSPAVWGLSNNREYIFKMQGTLDWKDGKANKDTFEFNFFVDYEAPRIDSYSVRFDPYTENKETKYRIYLDVNVYDNRYAQDLLPCYVKDEKLTLLTEHAVPVYSTNENSVTQVSIDITDIYDDYYDDIYLAVEDYALNQSIYHLDLTHATKYCDTVRFATDGDKFVQADTRYADTAQDGQVVSYAYDVYDLALAPNEAYTLLPTTTPTGTYSHKLSWQSSDEAVAVGGENTIFAKKAGSAVISVKDGNGYTKAQIRVTVSGTEKRKPLPDKLTLRPVLNKSGYVQSLAQSGTTLELYPATQLQLEVETDPWYVLDGLELAYTSSNPSIVAVDENGYVTVSDDKRGVATVTVYAKDNERIRASVRIRVVSPYRIVNYTLYEYHGPNEVVIPDELNIMYLDEDAFQGNKDITSVVLPRTLTEIPENAFKGCTNLRSVTVSSGTITIGKSAFEGCVRLETLTLDTFTDKKHPEVSEKYPNEEMIGAVTVASRAFYGCVNLKNIVNQLRLTTVGAQAFAGCTSLTSLDLRAVAVAYRNAFENCTSLSSVLFSPSTAASENMFKGCTGLQHVYAAELPKVFVDPEHPEDDPTLEDKKETYPMRAVADGMFFGCTALQNVTFTSALRRIGANAFSGSGLTGVTLDSAVALGANAFSDCNALASLTIGANAALTVEGVGTFSGCKNLNTITVDGNSAYTVNNNVLYANGTEVVFIPESVTTLTLSGVQKIGNGAFAGRTDLKSIDLSGVTEIGDRAFAGTGITSLVLPASITKIGEGAFEGCASLTSVTWQTSVTNVPAALFRDCVSLGQITLPDTVTEIGTDAFYGCTALTSVSLGQGVTRIGVSAFEKTYKLSSVTLPASLKYIGSRAFADARSLTGVEVPAVTDMGVSVFVGCANITKLTFGQGATFIGSCLFAEPSVLYGYISQPNTSALTELVIPSTVTVIDDGAFYGCAALERINGDNRYDVNLDGVISVGAWAFAYTGLKNVRLPDAKFIGANAFAESDVDTASLDSAIRIGEKAFYRASNLIGVTFPQVETIGANAFTGTKLGSVKLPASFDSYTYELTMNVRKNSGEWEDQTIRKESMGAGAFADVYGVNGNYISGGLTAITVDKENPVFFDNDGVLYARVANGYALVQYPSLRPGDEYTVLDGTVRIEPSAFSSVFYLKKLNLPASLESIGSGAFYMSNVTEYVFAGVQAPTLDSDYVQAYQFENSDNVLEYLLYRIFATEGSLELGSQTFYNNFYYYVALITEEKNLNESGLEYTAPSFGLSVTYPENGTGYDNVIWKAFFAESKTSAYAADAVTLAAQKAIAALPEVSKIEQAATIGELNALHDEFVRPARVAYNAIADARQIALVTTYDKLAAAESAVRAARSRLGSPARVQSLKIASAPDKQRYYENETLDTTGLRVVAVYDDDTEEEVSAYTVDKTGALALSDSEVRVSYQGATALFYISVSRYIEYTVTFAGDGISLRPMQVEAGKCADVKDPTRKGYVFDGWVDEDGEVFDTESTAVLRDMTLTAQWIKMSGTTQKKKCGGAMQSACAWAAAILLLCLGACLAVRAKKQKNA